MLTTAAEARDRVCLLDMAGGNNVMAAGHCRGEECSAWRWEAAREGAKSGERLGYCGLIGRVERRVRKRPQRLVEAMAFVPPSGFTADDPRKSPRGRASRRAA